MANYTSYVTWDGTEAMTVRFENYGDGEGQWGCEVKEENCIENGDYYPKNQVMYTKDSEYPYNRDEIC